MGILTGRNEALKLLALSDLAFIGTLTDYAKGMSTRSSTPTTHYTLEFDKYEQIRGTPIKNDEPHFHYMQIGSSGQITDPKTHKLIPAPEPKHLQAGQLYLALLNEPQQIKQLVEITTDDVNVLRQAALEK
ncbi:unnamed protein product [Rotaria sordida]|uniref:Uncharacterized protein n=1 Tax=Rotaria sordida TaxID=392033 RepID=A0A814HGP9_9BILA|nr:unnamed protein product [Rotaria sordida]CAF1564620.1 unnamed protein product [Rotaria sordida]CAF3973949.1 unnamed protein product [Rotaria sordida]CAF4286663.1 unnamed protein product [Rotaria sordida]